MKSPYLRRWLAAALTTGGWWLLGSAVLTGQAARLWLVIVIAWAVAGQVWAWRADL